MSTQLTAEAVFSIFRACLYTDDELAQNAAPHDAVVVDSVIGSFGFHPGRIAAHTLDIRALLTELPDEFHIGKGGGMSFLNACVDRHGNQWGEHRDINHLVSLGLAIGAASYPMPRELWEILQGGMPYVTVDAFGGAEPPQ